MKSSLHYIHKIPDVLPTVYESAMHKGKVVYFTVCYLCDQYMKYFM